MVRRQRAGAAGRAGGVKGGGGPRMTLERENRNDAQLQKAPLQQRNLGCWHQPGVDLQP